jgi:pyrimidine operon attenuation protein/uracil phosphoribosyltransferase
MKTVLTGPAVRRIIVELANRVAKKYKHNMPALVGIHTNGVFISRRMAGELQRITGRSPDLGTLDITFYRDDLGYADRLKNAKETCIDFAVEGRDILLVDDVIYTGRTIRAAMDQLLELGRPRSIAVAVLIDRGMRELPIAAEFVGMTVATRPQDRVQVVLAEGGERDRAFIYDETAAQ